jgi:hypothetical protein
MNLNGIVPWYGTTNWTCCRGRPGLLHIFSIQVTRVMCDEFRPEFRDDTQPIKRRRAIQWCHRPCILMTLYHVLALLWHDGILVLWKLPNNQKACPQRSYFLHIFSYIFPENACFYLIESFRDIISLETIHSSQNGGICRCLHPKYLAIFAFEWRIIVTWGR